MSDIVTAVALILAFVLGYILGWENATTKWFNRNSKEAKPKHTIETNQQNSKEE